MSQLTVLLMFVGVFVFILALPMIAWAVRWWWDWWFYA